MTISDGYIDRCSAASAPSFAPSRRQESQPCGSGMLGLYPRSLRVID